MKKLLLIVMLTVLVGLGGFYGYRYINKSKNVSNDRKAIILTNGQVYFGFIKDESSKSVVLSDVYYLKSDNRAQEGEKKKLILVKMGSEVYGPQSTMTINRDQVLFIQNIQQNSKISEAINASLNSQTK